MVNGPEEDKPQLPPFGNFDCVLRSLESATGASATPEEKELRRMQMIAYRDKFATPFDEHFSLELLIQAVETERDNIKSLIKQITESNNPLGLALKRFCMSEEDLYPKQATETIQQGDQIILLATYHAAHLGIGSTPNTFISHSDGGKELTLNAWQRIHVLKLAPVY